MKGLHWRPLTPDVLEGILKVRERIKSESGGAIFEDSTEAVRRMREERTEYLMQLHSQHSLHTPVSNE